MATSLRSIAPDVAHTNNLSGISVALWGCLRRMGIPIAHTLRDYYLICPNTAQFRNGVSCGNRCGACRVMGAPRIAATRHVNTVIGNSHFVLESHLRAGAFESAHRDVIYIGYEAPIPVAPRVAVPGNRPFTLGFIGRLAPTKGVELLMDAFARAAAASTQPMVLRIAGTGDVDYVRSLRERAKDWPIELIGKVAPATFYESVDVTVVPSLWHEPLARVIFESFAHGVPVLASSRGGSPELVVPGKTGWLFDPSEEGALVRAIGQAVSEMHSASAAALSSECLSESQRFLPDRVVESHLRTFERMVGTLARTAS
jgi:glycosyltransferase involved in cell wall biosynthesis